MEIGLGWSVLTEALVRDLHVMPFEELSTERGGIYPPYEKNSVECRGGVFGVAGWRLNSIPLLHDIC